MTPHPVPTPRRRRALVGAAAALALAAGTLSGAVLAPTSAAPTEDCADTYPVDDVTPGQDLDGLTVTSGTDPEHFSAEVIGTMTDGIAPGIPMIIVKVDPAGLGVDPEVKGIWEGMSGSPVYDAVDHRLVGAISYGLSTQQSWVAGVTPYGAMAEYLGTSAPHARSSARLDGRLSRTVARAAGVSATTASSGFRTLPTPQAVAGISPALLQRAQRQAGRFSWLSSSLVPMGRMRAAAADPQDTIVAGGNLATGTSYGDIAMAAVGTATSVCDGEVVGFGHPMNLTGDTTMTLHPAEALYVQGDATPFKVANIGPAVGTVFGDHLTGVTGAFGAVPAATTVRSSLTYGTRSRTGTTYVSVRDVDNIASAALYETMMNQTVVLDSQTNGTTLLTWTITGTSAGKPFTLTQTSRYLTRSGGIPAELAFRVAMIAAQVTSMPGVVVDSVTTTGTATRDLTELQVVKVEQRRGKTWSAVTLRKPAVVRAGHKLVLRALLRGGGQSKVVPIVFTVPKGARGRMGGLMVAGGSALGLDLGSSITSAKNALARSVRGDAVLAEFGRVVDMPGEDEDEEFYEDFRVAAGRRATAAREPGMVAFTKRAVSAPGTSVVGGYRMALVMVR